MNKPITFRIINNKIWKGALPKSVPFKQYGICALSRPICLSYYGLSAFVFFHCSGKYFSFEYKLFARFYDHWVLIVNCDWECWITYNINHWLLKAWIVLFIYNVFVSYKHYDGYWPQSEKRYKNTLDSFMKEKRCRGKRII